jgi:hypothetical protein
MLHENIVVGDIHYIQNWSVVDNTARDALSVAAADVGKVVQVTDTQKFFVLADDSPMTWTELGGSGGAGDVVGPASATDNAISRFDSTTGKLIQDSGITIADGASGTLSGTNTGDQSLFSTIAVSGQSNVVADTTSDTLTLVAGTNITITTDATTDTITINSSGGGGNLNNSVYNRNSTNYTTSSTSFTDIDGVNLSLSVTTGARRVLVAFCGAGTNTTNGAFIGLDLLVDGVSVSSGEGILIAAGSANLDRNLSFTYVTDVLTAASHTFKLQWKASAGTNTLYAGAGGGPVLQLSAVELYTA